MQENTLLSRYRLIEEIGKGGMAVVYRGEDTALKREVAVKVLHSFLADKEESRRRFQREARVVAKLRHRNILEIYDYSGVDSEESFIVTEFIHGPTLSEFLQEHEIIIPEVGALIVAEICRAVSNAHESAVIHRDIKPENVMIARGGVLKLTDFGIAQIVDTQKLTLTGQLLGSPAYMAPEMVLGGSIDFRTDIFSIGVLLYRLSTGQLPFVGKNPHEVLKKIAEGEHTPPSMVCPAVSRDLETIIEKALEVEPDRRYDSVSDLLDDLVVLLEESGIEDPAQDVRSFFESPEAYQAALREAVIERLLEDARDLARDGRIPGALRCLNRVLALDEENDEVPELLKQLKRRQSFRDGLRSAAMVSAALVLFAGVAAGVWLLGSKSGEDGEGSKDPSRRGDVMARKATGDLADGGEPLQTAAPWTTPAEDGWSAPAGADSGQPVTPPRPDGGEVEARIRKARRRRRRRGAPRRTARGRARRPRGRKGQIGDAIAGERVFKLTPYPRAVKVSIDGGPARDYGPGLQEIKLGPGKHTIKLTSRFCYDKIIRIGPDMEGRELKPRLKWRKARLRVVSNVPADVQAGPTVGNTSMPLPVPVPKDSLNGHVKVLVKVSASGYHTWQTELKLRAGTTRKVRVDLKPL